MAITIPELSEAEVQSRLAAFLEDVVKHRWWPLTIGNQVRSTREGFDIEPGLLLRGAYRPHLRVRLSPSDRRVVVAASISVTETALELVILGITVVIAIGAAGAVWQSHTPFTTLWPAGLLVFVPAAVLLVAGQVGRRINRHRTVLFAERLSRTLTGDGAAASDVIDDPRRTAAS